MSTHLFITGSLRRQGLRLPARVYLRPYLTACIRYRMRLFVRTAPRYLPTYLKQLIAMTQGLFLSMVLELITRVCRCVALI